MRTTAFVVLTSLTICSSCDASLGAEPDNSLYPYGISVGAFRFEHKQQVEVVGANLNHAYQYVIQEDGETIYRVYLGYLDGHQELPHEICYMSRNQQEFELNTKKYFVYRLRKDQCFGHLIVQLSDSSDISVSFKQHTLWGQ